MTAMQSLLGLPEHEAVARLKAAGLNNINVSVSGRRREGITRVIRQNEADGRVELVVSYFKELDQLPPLPSGDIPLMEGDK